MQKYTREELIAICKEAFNDDPDNTVIDMLMIFQRISEAAYREGYHAALRDNEILLSTNITA